MHRDERLTIRTIGSVLNGSVCIVTQRLPSFHLNCNSQPASDLPQVTPKALVRRPDCWCLDVGE